MSVLAIAASDLAETLWEKQFAVWIACHDQDAFGIGTVGFDIVDILWETADFDKQKTFVLKTIAHALAHQRWEILTYKPSPRMDDFLKEFKELVEAFQIKFVNPNPPPWDCSEDKNHFEKCPVHQVYLHIVGCLLCNDLYGIR